MFFIIVVTININHYLKNYKNKHVINNEIVWIRQLFFHILLFYQQLI